MRIHNEIRSQAVSGAKSIKHPLKDMQVMFGGTITGSRLFHPAQHLEDARDSVSAFTTKNPTETIVTVRQPGSPRGALAWTAIQAYCSKGGLEPGSLLLEVPGRRGYEEYINRTILSIRTAKDALDAEHKRKSEALINDLSLSESEYDKALDRLLKDNDRKSQAIDDAERNKPFFATTGYASGQDPAEQFFDAMQLNIATQLEATADMEEALNAGDSVRAEMATREYLQARDANIADPSIDISDTSKHTNTLFYAQAHNLPTAAHIMAEGYGELYFHSDDAEVAVARALGVPSLTELDQVWERAMDTPTPLAAGRLVLTSFQ